MTQKEMIEALQQSLSIYTNKEFFFGDYMRKYNVPFPADVPEALNLFGLTAKRSALNTAVICSMMKKGYSYADITDPEKLKNERIEAAKEVDERFRRGNDEDKKECYPRYVSQRHT